MDALRISDPRLSRHADDDAGPLRPDLQPAGGSAGLDHDGSAHGDAAGHDDDDAADQVSEAEAREDDGEGGKDKEDQAGINDQELPIPVGRGGQEEGRGETATATAAAATGPPSSGLLRGDGRDSSVCRRIVAVVECCAGREMKGAKSAKKRKTSSEVDVLLQRGGIASTTTITHGPKIFSELWFSPSCYKACRAVYVDMTCKNIILLVYSYYKFCCPFKPTGDHTKEQ